MDAIIIWILLIKLLFISTLLEKTSNVKFIFLLDILVDGHIGDNGDGLLIFSGDILIGVFSIVIIFKDTLHL